MTLIPTRLYFKNGRIKVAISLAKGAIFNWIGVIIAVAVFALLLGTRINPAFLVLCGAVVGLFVFGGR